MFDDFRKSASADAPSSARQAALLLYGRSEADQEWLLAQLPSEERRTLLALLEELQVLGMPKDAIAFAEMGAEVPAARAAKSTDNSRTPPASAVERLSRLDEDGIQALLRCLAAEGHGVRSRLAAVKAWPWRERLSPTVGENSAVDPEPGVVETTAPLLKDALARALIARVEADLRGNRALTRGAPAGSAHARSGWQTAPLAAVKRWWVSMSQSRACP